MTATLTRPGCKPVAVRNLGWLPRNWQEVEAFHFDYQPDGMWDGRLIAVLRGGGTYVTKFASIAVCFRWLSRPVFRGLPLTIRRGEVAKGMWNIGDAKYVETMEMDGGSTEESHLEYMARLLP